MLCPSCQTPNRDNARFCKGCGALLAPEQAGTAQPHIQEQALSAPNIQQAETPESTQSDPTVQQTDSIVQKDAQQEDDIALAPTQILTPSQMMEYHKRQWERELQATQPTESTQATEDDAERSTTSSSSEAQAPSSETSSSQMHDIATRPTVIMAPPADTEESKQEFSSSEGTEEARQTPEAKPTVEEKTVTENKTFTKEETATVQDEQTNATSQPSTTTEAFPSLEQGTVLAGRYEITEIVDGSQKEHTYQVVDHQGYQHCWNCGSEQNAEGDEFCIDCGAELLNATYMMHEYPATMEQNKEARVLQGTIVNTFMVQNRTYVIEQPQVSQLVFPTGVHLTAACDSDAGNLRRGEPNEDSTLALLLERVHESIASPTGVFVVADGMGGHDNGQGASRKTIGIIAEHIISKLLLPPLAKEKTGETAKEQDEDSLVALIHGAVEEANTALCQLNQQEQSDMGSTLTGFMIVGDHAYVFNVGDSRTYLLRDGNLRQLTTDHSLVGQLVAGGLIEPEDVYTHPQRSQIYRSIGDKLSVQIDIFKQQIHPDDILLSCSDGLWEMVRDSQITEILTNALDPQMACSQLIEAANANGGEDNVSAVVVFVR